VSFDSPTRGVTCHQLVWLLEGEMEITIDCAREAAPADG
jgi:hypothetical protein